ncbi:PDZ domain [Trinorchestia longiramus]|nr:PDZ domain [Trinorchestia longiramus]
MVGLYDTSRRNWGEERSLRAPKIRPLLLKAGKYNGKISVNVISDGITRLPILEGEISHVEIPRPKGVPLGITIVGGADTPLRCVVVQEVFPDGLIAQDGRLQSGDQIIEVDGVDMTAATHAHVCQELRKFTQPTLKLGVYRERIQAYRQSPSSAHQPIHSLDNVDCTSVTLWREEGRHLGIQLGGHRTKPGIFVYKILPGSVAALDARLQLHDRIIAINGHDVRFTRIDMASRLIERSRTSVTLSVTSKHSFYDQRNGNSERASNDKSASDGTSLCSNASESFSDHSSSSASPRIFLPSLAPSSDSSSGLSGSPSTDQFSSSLPPTNDNSFSSCPPLHPSPPLTTYPHSDVSSATTDTEDSDSHNFASSANVSTSLSQPESANASWQASPESNDRDTCDNGLDHRWPPLPQKPRLTQKMAVIKKACNESLGMRIGGGVSSNEGDTPIYIANINNNGSAGRSNKVKKGDVLLAVNGQSLLGLTHSQAVAQLKATAALSVVTLLLLESPESCSSSAANFVPSWLYWQKLPRPLQISRSVVLQRSPGSSLGFSIVGGSDPNRGSEPIHVLLVVASSPAAVDGKLRCGDRILAVDNYSLESVSHATAVGLLKQAGQRVHLEVVSWLGTEL